MILKYMINQILITGKESRKTRSCSTGSTCSSGKRSTNEIKLIIEKLKCQQNRESTNKTYLSVWRQFNCFVISLDVKPRLWEDRTSLFIAHLVEKGIQSGTIKSYVSAIKKTLVDDNYQWQDDKVLLGSLTRACKLINDRVRTRLPIQCGLLELILFEIQRIFTYGYQSYLESLYKAMFALGYYGLMRVGELTFSQHVVKARNVHIADNKDKLLIILYSSKTHGLESRPQKIKITSSNRDKVNTVHRNFCPFKLIRDYLRIRGGYLTDEEPFFIYRDRTPVKPVAARELLKGIIKTLGLNSNLYDMHSLRIGRTTDLAKFYSIDEVRRFGRWRSNVVYKYIRE